MIVSDLQAIRIKLASPEEILSWSKGEVTKPETINYRTQKAEKDGLFCERIFGPEKDYECYCGKYKRIRYKGVICDRCGVEVTKSSVRRERMGDIKLACPVSHIWFLRGVPSRMGMVLDIPMQQLERVIYFAAYIVTNVNEGAKKKALEDIEKEYKSKIKNKRKLKTVLEELKKSRDRAKEEVNSIKPLKIFSEIEYYDFSLKYGEIFEAGTGAETLRKIFEKIDLKKEISDSEKEAEKATPIVKRKILRRLGILKAIAKAGIRPEWMFQTVIPVLPPDLRPMVQLDGGRYASSDLNDLYRRVINRNNRLKYLLEIDAPEVIVRNEKRMLQEAVDALIDNSMRKGVLTTATTGGRRLLKSLADMLKGKQGRFRQNLLGKRVDYAGRSVIVVGPELRLRQCGLPKKMALELFKPFVIKRILDRELAYNVRGASKLIEQETDEVWAILEEVVKDKLVLLNRAPTLHQLGIQAFQPVLVEGESIQIHPLVCKAFNADFDGDQMAVHVPLSEEAQKEAKEIMLATLNLLKPATGTPIVAPTQDIVLGCYWLTKIYPQTKGEQGTEDVKIGKASSRYGAGVRPETKAERIFSSSEEAILAYEHGDINLREKIKVLFEPNSLLETSLGRILFNEALPENYPFVNEMINSKKIEEIVGDIIENYGQQIVEETLDKIKDLGFRNATMSGVTWGMNDLIVPPQKEEIIEKAEKEIDTVERHFRKGLLSKEEKSSKVIEIWARTKSEIEKLIPETLPEFGPIFTIIASGSRGSWTQPVQMTGMKGLVINPAGQIIELPVRSSFKEGFNVLEYFISTHGARKGTADTALRTSTAGYLTRRLVDVAHEMVISEEDCGDKKGFEILKKEADEIGQSFSHKIAGRVLLEELRVPLTNSSVSVSRKNKGHEADRKSTAKEIRKKEPGVSPRFRVIKKGEIIDWRAAKEISEAGIEKVKIRSPISCQSVRGICQKCYGWNLALNKLVELGEAVGIVAAQAIGEPGTQLTMRTFHTGGVAGGGDITFGLPRVQEIFEARTPGGRAEISQVDGKVLDITPKRVIRIKSEIPASPAGGRNPLDKIGTNSKSKKSPAYRQAGHAYRQAGKTKKADIIEYKIPPEMAILVEKGENISKGQQLCEGNLDLKELFKLKNKEATQRYVLKEIQKIYVSQGAAIQDKHIEVIIRQMFSRVKIKDPGDSTFSSGEVVERAKFLEENAKIKKEKKNLAKAVTILLGISRVSLSTDSFLSAASFQETSRVLIKAALEGKEDRLRGLKENVIIGKLIPAGTGFRK